MNIRNEEETIAAILMSQMPVQRYQLPKQHEKYQALLLSGWQEFNDKGFFSTTVLDITQRAGVAKGTFYLYFQDKHDLLEVIVNAFFQTGLDWMENNIKNLEKSEGITTRDILDAVIKEQLFMLLSHRSVAKFLFFDLSFNPEKRFASKGAVRERYYELIGDLLMKGIARGELREDLEVRTATIMLEGAIYWHIYLIMAANNSNVDIESMARNIVDIYVQGISCPIVESH